MVYIPTPEQCGNKAIALSGASYVYATLRDNLQTGDRVRREDGVRLPYSPKVDECNHTDTICEGCCDSWAYDYAVFYSRTAGGRNLAQQLQQTPEELYNEQKRAAELWDNLTNQAREMPVQQTGVCQVCHGTGKAISDAGLVCCWECDGTGTV